MFLRDQMIRRNSMGFDNVHALTR